MPLLDIPTPSLSAALLPYIFSAASLLLTLLALFRKESRENGQTTGQRLQKLELNSANQDARQSGFQNEIEGVADHAERERRTMVDIAKRDYDSLREQIKDIPTMRELLYRMVERLENTGKAVEKVDAKMDRIVDLLTHK